MARYSMYFSIPNWSSAGYTIIGSDGETVWSLRVAFGGYGSGWVEISRSKGNGEVKIDVVGTIKERKFISQHGHRLLDGQQTTRLRTRFIEEGGVFIGYVTVHYNSNFAPTSKNEETNRLANNFITSIAEKFQTLPNLASDLSHLLDNPDETFSDAALVCGTERIRVHRNILSARSPVFAAMFRSQMQEGHEGVVDIVDIEPDVLRAMLRYVYSGKTDHLTNSLAGDLLFAADKYQLEELMLICVEALKVSMAVDNVFRSLVLIDLHDESLKENAVDFICKCKNFSDLEKSEEWRSLLKERPVLAVEVTTAVVKYLQKK